MSRGVMIGGYWLSSIILTVTGKSKHVIIFSPKICNFSGLPYESL